MTRIALFWAVDTCWDCVNRGVCSIQVEGGVRLNFSRDPLFWGVFTRRCGIVGGYGVRLIILTKIPLFWDMDPQGARANKGVSPL